MVWSQGSQFFRDCARRAERGVAGVAQLVGKWPQCAAGVLEAGSDGAVGGVMGRYPDHRPGRRWVQKNASRSINRAMATRRVVCYSGEGSKRDGTHTPREFTAIARRSCKRDCPKRTDDLQAWAEWAGADLLGPDHEEYCRCMVQGQPFFKALARPLTDGKEVTMKLEGRSLVLTASGTTTKSMRIPLNDLNMLKYWIDLSRAAARAQLQAQRAPVRRPR